MALGVIKREKENQKDPVKKISSTQEKAVAKAVGGKQQVNSGACEFLKGDVYTTGDESFLLECKTKATHANSIKIKKEWFTKQKEEMIFMGKQHSAIIFSFGPDEENHYIIDEYLFKELLEHLKENK